MIGREVRLIIEGVEFDQAVMVHAGVLGCVRFGHGDLVLARLIELANMELTLARPAVATGASVWTREVTGLGAGDPHLKLWRDLSNAHIAAVLVDRLPLRVQRHRIVGLLQLRSCAATLDLLGVFHARPARNVLEPCECCRPLAHLGNDAIDGDPVCGQDVLRVRLLRPWLGVDRPPLCCDLDAGIRRADRGSPLGGPLHWPRPRYSRHARCRRQ